MTPFDDLAQRYVDAWNETDPAALRSRVAALYADDGRYVDPLGEAVGHDAIAATIETAQRQFPGLCFRLVGPVDAHHSQARFRWELGPATPTSDPAPVAGFDVVVVDDDGRLSAVLGFLDRVPAAS